MRTRVCLKYFSILTIIHLDLFKTSPQHRYAVQTSIASFFFSSFVVIYCLNETCVFFILVFSYPILVLSLYFPIFYFSSVCLPRLSFFVYPLLSLSTSVSFFVCLLSFSSDFLCLCCTFSFYFCLFFCLSSAFFFGCLLLSLFAYLLLYTPYSFCFIFVRVDFYYY